jgi:2'-5' RNA ligase
MTEPRYAIYLAPGPDTALWSFGSRVLGYDAASGDSIEGFSLPGFDPAAWRALTERPRVYGFHATLKAPFRLAPGMNRADLVAALDALAASRDAFDLGALGVRALSESDGHGFVALTLMHRNAALEQLEPLVVAELDRFRAPMTEAERAKRRPEQLTPRQQEALARVGYPYTGPDYLFHMTLTGAVQDVWHVADLLADAVANEVGGAHFAVEALVLYEQPGSGQPFRITHRAPLRQVDDA